MRIHSRWAMATIVGLGALAGDAQAAVEVEHESVPCALAGEYPRVAARIEPTDLDTRVRVFFHGGDAARWYAVPMHRESGEWVASLPRPRAAGRFAYYIAVSGPDAGGRAPEESAWVVEVLATCAGAHLETTPRGPGLLQVPPGAPLVPGGFDGDGIGGFVELAVDNRPALPVKAAPFWTSRLLPLSRVRVSTVPPPDLDAAALRKGESWVTVETPTGESSTFTRKGELIEGRVESFEEDAVTLAVDKNQKVRIRRESIARLEVREPGSTALGVVGGLAGAGAGFLATALVCSTTTSCDSYAILWFGTGLGAALGATAGAWPSWKPVTLVRQDAWSLELQPEPMGGSVRAAVRF